MATASAPRRFWSDGGSSTRRSGSISEPNFRERLHGLTGGWTVPQIVIDGTPIGGYLELWRLDREGILAAGTTAPGHEDRSSPQELDTDGNLAA